MLNLLPCVKTICCDCAAVAYPSAGVVVRRLGRPLTKHTAALIPDALGCLECGSKRVDVVHPYLDRTIVKAAITPRCRFCDAPIPEPFRDQFANADFCPLCVAAGRVSDAEVVAAYGTLFAGEAYRAMAAPFLHVKAVRLNWLRKAVKEGHVDACLALGDMLSGSSEPSEVAEAASAFKKAADQKTPDSYAQHRLALMMLHGRGLQADTEAAIGLLYSAGEKGDPYALSDLARFILNGQFGLKPDPCRAFELFRRAHDMNPEGIMHSAAVALMLLEGIGVEPNPGKGKETLRLAISIYAQNKPTFDAEACLEQVLTARKLAEGSAADFPSARVYLDWMAKLSVPGALRLLQRCGGPLPAYEPRWELSLSSALPEKIKGAVWWVNSPVRGRPGRPWTLGQIEKLANKRWIATTEAGVPIGEVFESEKDAVEALANSLQCDVPYVASATSSRRMHARPPREKPKPPLPSSDEWAVMVRFHLRRAAKARVEGERAYHLRRAKYLRACVRLASLREERERLATKI
jgi:TPR repeat protein